MTQRKTFQKGHVFLHYQVLRLIGQGGFADIYYVRKRKTDEKLAMKVERKDSSKQTLQLEERVFRYLGNSAFFPKFHESGETNKYRYYLMECLGPSLASIRKKLPGNQYSISSTLLLGINMLRCIRMFHYSGYIHRDIKPGNFLVRASRQYPLALIDYGLARLHLDRHNENKPIPNRPLAGFAGTLKYASINAHENKDLGRRDDLYSWFYSMIEMARGSLPWSDLKNKQDVYDMKKNISIEVLCESLPSEFVSIWRCLQQYEYQTEPNYKLLISFLVQAMDPVDATFDDRYDWEALTPVEKEHIAVVNFDAPQEEEPYVPSESDLVHCVIPGEEHNYILEKRKKKLCQRCIVC